MHLPKSYLSHSQISLWHRYRRGYVKRYFEGEPSYTSPEMEYGNYIENLIEKGNIFNMPEMLQAIYCDIPTGGYYQRKLVYPFSGFDCLGYADRMEYDYSVIDDYKTGKTPWDQERAESSDQLKGYALCVFLITGKIPLTRIVYLPTQGQKSEIELTGDLYIFPVQFEEKDLKEYKEKVEDTATEIAQAYKEWRSWKAETIDG